MKPSLLKRPATMTNKAKSISTTASDQLADGKASAEYGWLKIIVDWILQTTHLNFDENGCIRLTNKDFKRITMGPCNVLVLFYTKVCPSIFAS